MKSLPNFKDYLGEDYNENYVNHVNLVRFLKVDKEIKKLNLKRIFTSF